MPTVHRLSIPLLEIALPTLGIVSREAELPLFVRTSIGTYSAASFRLDTGAHVTEVSTDWARHRQVAINGRYVRVSVTSGSGAGLWSGWIGTLRVRLPMWSATEYEWPCFFREQRPPKLPPQLGLAGILNDLRLSLDGTPTSSAPYGHLLVEEYPAPATPPTP